MRHLENVNKAYDFFVKNREMLTLKNSIDFACGQKEIDLILGSSYARNGIDLYRFKNNVVNCSVSSMDLYWTLKIYNKIKSKQTQVKKLIIVIGYYSLYMELEKQTNEASIAIREKILRPIVDDANISMNENEDLDEIYELAYEMQKNRRGCYNDLYSRKSLLGLTKPWKNYSLDERITIGMERAKCHNILKKYTKSFIANCEIVNKIKSDCDINKTELMFIIPPFSKEYNNGICSDMKKELLTFLGEISVKYIDFNEMDIWLDDDFVDADHVSGCGAVKFSICLDEMMM